MDMLLLAVLLVGGLVFAVNSSRTRSGTELPTMDDTVPSASEFDAAAPFMPVCEQRDALLSVAERSLYGALKEAVGERYEIFVRPRIADVLLPTGVDGRSAFAQMADKCFDYVLCDKVSLRAMYAIELDDGRDVATAELLRQACVSAGLSLLRLRTGVEFSAAQLRALLRE